MQKIPIQKVKFHEFSPEFDSKEKTFIPLTISLVGGKNRSVKEVEYYLDDYDDR